MNRERLAHDWRATRLALALALLLGLLGLLPPATARAANLTVTKLADTNDGACDADCSLREAIVAAEATAAADTITFNLPGAGPWTIVLGSSLPGITRPLAIQGPGRERLTVRGNNTFPLVEIDAPGQAVALDGLTLSNGKATGAHYGGNLRSTGGNLALTDLALNAGSADPNTGGAGAYLSNGTSTLTRVIVSGNTAPGSLEYDAGAGLYIAEYFGNTTVAITQSTIVGNVATASGGGGLAVARTSGATGRTLAVTLTSTLVGTPTSPNTALAVEAAGGGIYHKGGSLTLTSSSVAGNQGQVGGGIYSTAGTLRLERSEVRSNSGYNGGGLYDDSETTFVGSTLANNVATADGGGLYGGGALTFLNSTVSGNRADYGGGLFSQRSLTLTNSTVSGNRAARSDGGIFNSGAATLTHATVVGNQAPAGGGIVTSYPLPPGATTTLDRSIVAGNAGGDCTLDGAAAAFATAGYNVVGQGGGCPASGPGDIADPRELAFLIDPILRADAGTTLAHALVPGSPALDRIPVAACTAATDQRGVARPQGPGCDSGAYEFDARYPLTVQTNGGGTVALSPASLLIDADRHIYPYGTTVTLTPQPSPGQVFVRWAIDFDDHGWAGPLTITTTRAYTVRAIFAPVASFTDVPGDRADAAAIAALAGRGLILGYGDGRFGPDDGVQRAQMAALIARATPLGPGVPPAMIAPPDCAVIATWDCEVWPNDFRDQGDLSPNLWRDVAALQHYGVARGYTAGDCAARGLASPCFAPTAPVSYAETVVFITRAMIAKGYWVAQPTAPQPYAGVPAVFTTELATFAYYTGGVPAPPADWNAGATRGWFARALWQALNSYWGTDGTLPDGRPAGGYTP